MSTKRTLDGKLTTPKYDLLYSRRVGEGGKGGGRKIRVTYEDDGDFGSHGCDRVSEED